MAAKKKTHFTGPEMSALSGPLTADQTRLAQASFFIAARVANAAWALFDALRQNDEGMREILTWLSTNNAARTALEQVQATLNEYSPGNIPPPPSFKTYAAQKLEELYAEAEQAPTREAVLEVLYNAIGKEYE